MPGPAAPLLDALAAFRLGSMVPSLFEEDFTGRLHNLARGSACPAEASGVVGSDSFEDVSGLRVKAASRLDLLCLDCSWDVLEFEPRWGAPVRLDADVAGFFERVRRDLGDLLDPTASTRTLTELAGFAATHGPALAELEELAPEDAALRRFLDASAPALLEEFDALAPSRVAELTLPGPPDLPDFSLSSSARALRDLRDELTTRLASDTSVVVVPVKGSSVAPLLDLAVPALRARALPGSDLAVVPRAHFELLRAVDALTNARAMALSEHPGTGLSGRAASDLERLFAERASRVS